MVQTENTGIKKAALYNAIAKYGSMIVQLGMTMLLSRLIVPEAYGVIAITTVLLGFLSLFADMGLGINIVQHPEMPTNDIRCLFSFSIVIGIILGFFTAIASFPLASVYEEPLYYVLCPILSVVSFFQAANVIPNSILMRDKRFKTIAIRTILCCFISGLVAVLLAYSGLGVYALVIQSVISQLFLFAWNYCCSPIIPTMFKFKRIMSLLGTYSLYQVLFNFLNYFTRNLDNLIIGKFFGPAPLAQYNKSYMLYLYPNNIFAAVLTGVLHPYIRDYKYDINKMFTKYLQIEKALSLIGIFTMITFFSCSKELVVIMFGKNWELAGEYLKCLSLCMWTQMMCSTAGSIFLGLERTDQTFKCGLINLSLLIISITIGVYLKSLLILSLCISFSYNLIFIVTNVILVKYTMRLSLKDFFKPIICDFGFAFSFIVLLFFLPEISSNLFLSLIVKLIICSIGFIIYLFVSNQWKTIVAFKYMIK